MTSVRPFEPTPSELVGVRAVLGAAFADDPMMRWIFRGVPAQEHAIALWIGLFVEALASVGTIDVAVDDDGTLLGAAAWRHDGTPMPFGELPTVGGMMTAVLGEARMVEVVTGLGEFAARKPEPPYHYLMFLGVHPSAQGKGAGRRLVTAGQARAAAAGQGVYLESTSERNLTFYASCGFEERPSFVLGQDGPPAFPRWWSP